MNNHIRKAGLAGAVALTLLASACGNSTETTAASADPAACPNGEVRFGIEPYEAPAKLTPAYTVLAQALEKGLGCPVKLTIVEDYAAEVLAMKNGKLDIAQFGPLGFVFASLHAQAEPVASFGDATGALSSYEAGIWVPKESSIQSLADLRGKKLALSSIGSTSGDALPRYALQKAGIMATDLTIQYAGGHPEALLALTNGKVDAGEINTQQMTSAVAANAINPDDYRRVWASAPVPNDPITVFGGLDPAFKARVAAVLAGLSPSDVAEVGKFLDIDPAGPMVAVTKDTYQELFDLANLLHLTEQDV